MLTIIKVESHSTFSIWVRRLYVYWLVYELVAYCCVCFWLVYFSPRDSIEITRMEHNA